jgi:hypothetical protein
MGHEGMKDGTPDLTRSRARDVGPKTTRSGARAGSPVAATRPDADRGSAAQVNGNEAVGMESCNAYDVWLEAWPQRSRDCGPHHEQR